MLGEIGVELHLPTLDGDAIALAEGQHREERAGPEGAQEQLSDGHPEVLATQVRRSVHDDRVGSRPGLDLQRLAVMDRHAQLAHRASPCPGPLLVPGPLLAGRARARTSLR